jgi:hypothetical protein
MPSKREADRVTVLLSPQAEEFIRSRVDPVREFGAGRESISTPTTNTIERYAALIADGDEEVQEKLSKAEINYLRDILNGTFITPDTISNLWMEVSDAESEYANKWGVNDSELVVKLQIMPLNALCAIVENVEAYWRKAK